MQSWIELLALTREIRMKIIFFFILHALSLYNLK